MEVMLKREDLLVMIIIAHIEIGGVVGVSLEEVAEVLMRRVKE
jgi:hypothetical protein